MDLQPRLPQPRAGHGHAHVAQCRFTAQPDAGFSVRSDDDRDARTANHEETVTQRAFAHGIISEEQAMTTATSSRSQPQQPTKLPPLEPGDKLDQKTFHERYEAMPPRLRAELIGGIVYMPSPLRSDHGFSHADVMAWLGRYKFATLGTDVLDNATNILGGDSEPQPDAALII